MRTPLLFMAALSWVAGCDDAPVYENPTRLVEHAQEAESTTDSDHVTIPDGQAAGLTPSTEPLTSFPLYALTPNFDDDTRSGQPDWFDQRLHPVDDDPLALNLTLDRARYPLSGTLVLSLNGDIENYRVWSDTGAQLLGAGMGARASEVAFEAWPEQQSLYIEAGNFLASATLEVQIFDAVGDLLGQAGVDLLASPKILNHHLQPSEQVWVMSVPTNTGFGSTYNNLAMRQQLSSVLGPALIEVPYWTYDGDVWLQDQLEYGTLTGSGGRRITSVINSARDRGLETYASAELGGPDRIGLRWDRPAWSGYVDTLDSFGNLEVSPPVTVNGVHYPFGRIYHGGTSDWFMNPRVSQFLEEQRIQAPFQIDSTWLVVAHVDEFVTFIPDPDAPKGFRMLIADVDLGYEVLNSLPTSTPLPRFGADKGLPTVGSILGWSGLRAYNERIQEDYLEPNVEILKRELGLTNADILRVPALFEPADEYWQAAALFPGTVNLLVANDPAGQTHLFMPDPFMRTHDWDTGSDPFIRWFEDNLPASLGLHFVDNWFVYHLGLGEVHCGTNTQRAPIEDWWTRARHLLE
jgi:hypothetical protein